MGEPKDSVPEFGKSIRDSDFLLDPTSVHVNHGSWGSLPKKVFEERIRILKEIEFQPDTHFRRKVEGQWFQSLGVVCKHLKLKAENVAFVENATGGINTILKSLPLGKGDQILIYSWTYNAIKNTVMRTCQMTGAEMVTLELKYPIKSSEEVIEKYRHMMETHPKIKVAVIDYISSSTATKFPIKDLIEICKKHDVMSLIDGAHTPGQINLDIDSLLPDFYTGTLHKWVFCPRGSSIVWINPKHHGKIYPVVTSHGYQSQNWQEDFFQQGTRDTSIHLTCPAGVEFYKSVGGMEKIQGYVTPLLEKAVQHLVNVWGTEAFPIPADMEAPYLRGVRLPELPQYPVEKVEGTVFTDMDDLMADLYSRFNIHATALGIQGERWVRLSGNIYNYMEEYEKLGTAILTLKEEGSSS